MPTAKDEKSDIHLSDSAASLAAGAGTGWKPELVMVMDMHNTRSRKATHCMLWSIALSLPLWAATLAVVKVVIVPELRTMSAQWSGHAPDAQQAGSLYAHINPRPLLHAGRHEAHVMAQDVMRHI